MKTFHKILSVPQNIVMDLNSVMLAANPGPKCQLVKRKGKKPLQRGLKEMSLKQAEKEKAHYPQQTVAEMAEQVHVARPPTVWAPQKSTAAKISPHVDSENLSPNEVSLALDIIQYHQIYETPLISTQRKPAIGRSRKSKSYW